MNNKNFICNCDETIPTNTKDGYVYLIIWKKNKKLMFCYSWYLNPENPYLRCKKQNLMEEGKKYLILFENIL